MNFTELVRSVFNRYTKSPVVRGNAVDELAIVPTSLMLESFNNDLEGMKRFYDNTQWSSLTSEEKDKAAAKRFIYRVKGKTSSGTVRIYSDYANAFTMLKETEFIDSVSSGRFVPARPGEYSSSSWIGNNGTYYVDIDLVSKTPGGTYNIKKGSGLTIIGSNVNAKHCSAVTDFVDGADTEGDDSLFNRVITSMSDRSPVMARGINSIMKENFPSVISHFVATAGSKYITRDLVKYNDYAKNVFLGKARDVFGVKHKAFFDFYPPTVGSQRLSESTYIASTELPLSINEFDDSYGDWAYKGIDKNEFTDDMYKKIYFDDTNSVELNIKAISSKSMNNESVYASKTFGIRVDAKLPVITDDYYVLTGNDGDSYLGIGVCIRKIDGEYYASVVHSQKLGGSTTYFAYNNDGGGLLTTSDAVIEKKLDGTPGEVSIYIENGYVSVWIEYRISGGTDLTVPSSIARNITQNESQYGKCVRVIGTGSSIVEVYDITESRPIAMFRVAMKDKTYKVNIDSYGESSINKVLETGSISYIWEPIGDDGFREGSWVPITSDFIGDSRYFIKINGDNFIHVITTTAGKSYTPRLDESYSYTGASLLIGGVSIIYDDDESFHSLNKADIYVQTKLNYSSSIIETIAVKRDSVSSPYVISGMIVGKVVSAGGPEFLVERTGEYMTLQEQVVVDIADERTGANIDVEVYPSIENIQMMYNRESVFGNVLVRHKIPVDLSIEFSYFGSGSETDVADEVRRYFDAYVTNSFSITSMIDHLSKKGLITSAVTDGRVIDIEPTEFFNITSISAVK